MKPETAADSFFTRWERVIKSLRCVTGHRWYFRHDAKPPVVVCLRCGRTEPMSDSDQRMPYL